MQSRFVPVFLLAFIALYFGTSTPGFTDATLSATAKQSLEDLKSDYISDVFEAVALEVAYEPYAGLQLGAAGTALNKRGNSIDQAMLLAHLLEDQVAGWRLASGRLDNASLSHLLANTSPAYEMAKERFSGDYEYYDPINDRTIQKVARSHFWLEIQEEEGDEWVALDPSFPLARIGQAYAKTSRTYSQVPANQHQRLSITIKQQTANGRTRKLGSVQGSVAELSKFPISLVVRGIPQYEASKEKPKKGGDNGMVGSSGGGLLGGSGFGGQRSAPAEAPASEPKSDAAERGVVGTEYRRELTHSGRAPEKIKATMVSHKDESTQLAREWIEFALTVPGSKTRRFSRDLFVASTNDPTPAAVRRYSIAVVAGEVSRAILDDYRGALRASDVSDARRNLKRLKAKEPTNETALEVLQLESSGALAPYLIAMAFAYESDQLSKKLAAGAGVRIVRDIPRVLMTTVETGADTNGEISTQTTLDLRLDEVNALPLSGVPVGATTLFQKARGMQESALEGRVLARFVQGETDPITTERVMQAAQKQGKQLIVLTPNNRAGIAELLNLPAAAKTRVLGTLDSGHQVIIPTAAAQIDGRSHWGWWDVNPATGSFVGVLESGQHQAMVQYTVTLEEIGVNDAMGYILGAMVGSTATMTLYSAKMLEYGAVTPELIQEVAAGIEQLTCVTCPSFEVIVSPVAASASVSSQCFKETGKSIGTGVGVSGSIDFCENYKVGISCAASLMLGTFEVDAQASVGSNIKADLGPLSCQ